MIKLKSISEVVWTIIILVVGAMIGIATMLYNKDMPNGFAVIWGYIGILVKHRSVSGFDS